MERCFVNLTTLTIFALTQILIPPLLLVKRFLFDVGFNCMTMNLIQLILISFMTNVLNKIGVTGFTVSFFVSVTTS